MSIADAMATNGMKEMGYEYINFDGKAKLIATMNFRSTHLLLFSDCWADSRDSAGNIIPNKERFPK